MGPAAFNLYSGTSYAFTRVHSSLNYLNFKDRNHQTPANQGFQSGSNPDQDC